MALSPAAWRRNLLGLGLVEISFDAEMGVTAGGLDLNSDPVDRIVAATALLRGAILITAHLDSAGMAKSHVTLRRTSVEQGPRTAEPWTGSAG